MQNSIYTVIGVTLVGIYSVHTIGVNLVGVSHLAASGCSHQRRPTYRLFEQLGSE